MNTKLNKWFVVGYGIALLLASANHVSAFYNPSTGRWLSRDPVQDPSFLPQNVKVLPRTQPSKLNVLCYVFVQSDPINRYDLLGLSASDVAKILQTFTDAMNYMCDNCLRCDFANNVRSWRPGSKLMGCGNQAAFVYFKMKQNTYDDTWNFHLEDNFDTTAISIFLPHQWGEGNSSLAGDPWIIFDPHQGFLQFLYPDRTEKYTIKCDSPPRKVKKEVTPNPYKDYPPLPPFRGLDTK